MNQIWFWGLALLISLGTLPQWESAFDLVIGLNVRENRELRDKLTRLRKGKAARGHSGAQILNQSLCRSGRMVRRLSTRRGFLEHPLENGVVEGLVVTTFVTVN